MKKLKRNKKVQSKPVLQVVSVARVNEKPKVNGKANSNGFGINSRNFETRFEPRYKKMPDMPNRLAAPSFSESSNKILKERYLLKGGNLGAIETVAERFWHIAYDIASADFDFSTDEKLASKQVLELAEQFYGMLVQQEFLPNSPTIMNAGKQNGLQYSACFVLPVEDDLEAIFETVKHTALIHQSGGGTGFAFSRLRPNGSIVESTNSVASGPVSFLRVYNSATEAVKQGGTRRGANMGILRIDHPDILEFIRCKATLDDLNKPIYDGIAPLLDSEEKKEYLKTLLLDKQIANFNISCAATDEFMASYNRGEDFNLVNPHTSEVAGALNAREVFDEIIERAWKTGDPGLVFIDRINHSPANPIPDIELIESTNPCGEQPLQPYDACNLGSINLGKFVLEDHSGVDWERLREVVRKSVHFLDNVVQVNPYTLREIYDKVHSVRRIGLGVMGWADMLFRLKTPYDSQEAVSLAGQVMKFINDEGHKMSEELAEVRGPFPLWNRSIYADKQSLPLRGKTHPNFKIRGESYAYSSGKPIRNSTVTTIAPTGTISIIGDCSSGIEPVFALAYIHRAKKAGNDLRFLTIANQTFEAIAKSEGFWSEDLAQKVMDHGSVAGLDGVPSDWQKVFVTAGEINPDWHVKMQAAFQKYTDNGVSKTINLPNSATRDDVKKAYLLAWETGCSGITVYRDGSKTTQVLNVSSTLKPAVEVSEQSSQAAQAERPIILRGRTYKMNTPVGKAYITVNRDGTNQPFEVFVSIGKAGMHTLADAEAIGRLASLALRVSYPSSKDVAKEIVEHLGGIGGSSQVGFGKDRIMSLADAVSKALAEDLALNANSEVSENAEQVPLNLTVNGESSREVGATGQQLPISSQVDLCPECGDASFVYEEGCKKCHSCGYSMC